VTQQPAYYPAPPTARRTDTMAILGLVFAFVFWPLGIVFSVLGRRNTARDGSAGRGLATAGLWVSIAFGVIAVLWAVGVVVLLLNSGTTAP
jgi:hypothetical protein